MVAQQVNQSDNHPYIETSKQALSNYCDWCKARATTRQTLSYCWWLCTTNDTHYTTVCAPGHTANHWLPMKAHVSSQPPKSWPLSQVHSTGIEDYYWAQPAKAWILCLPVYSGGQRQVNVSTPSSHVAPFWHVFPTQSSAFSSQLLP